MRSYNTEGEANAANRRYADWQVATSSDPKEARPEFDLTDRDAMLRHAWRWNNAMIRMVAAALTNTDAEDTAPLDASYDNDVLVAQMQASLAVGW